MYHFEGTTTARLGDAELSDKYFNLILRSSGMEEFRPDAQIALMAARFIFHLTERVGMGDWIYTQRKWIPGVASVK